MRAVSDQQAHCRQAFVAKPLSPSLCRQAFVAKPLSPSLCRQAFVAKPLSLQGGTVRRSPAQNTLQRNITLNLQEHKPRENELTLSRGAREGSNGKTPSAMGSSQGSGSTLATRRQVRLET